MNMIYSFTGFLTRRKQAYTGKPASCMYYDKDKGRYVIDGECESEEEEVKPPPKLNVLTPEQEAEQKRKIEEEKK